MPSKYNDEQTKLRMKKAIEMRDYRSPEGLMYDRQYIKKVTGITHWQGVHLGLFPNSDTIKQMRAMVEKFTKAKSDARREARGRKPFEHGSTFRENQRNRPAPRGA